jgi:hypothetical protein
MEDHVVEPEVAMHDGGFIARRNVLRQPREQVVHRRDGFRLRRSILVAPALDLPCEVVARTAVVREADRRIVDRMQERDHTIHLVVQRRALLAPDARQRLVPEDASVDVVHDEERRAEDARVFA